MKIIYNRFLPIKGFIAINLFGVLFARKEYNPLDNWTLNHEAIHTAQMKELLYVFFYLLYAIEWVINLIKTRDFSSAYYRISFEQEAYIHQTDMSYLRERKAFAQWRKQSGN